MKFVFNFLIFLSYAVFSGSGLIILKIALTERPFNLRNLTAIFFSPKFIAGMVLYLCGFMIWMSILSRFKLNVAYPAVVSLFFIITGLGSYFILKEPYSFQHIMGTALCLLGIILIGIK